MDGQNDDLDDNIRDKLVSATKGAVSVVPWVGGPLGELIGVVIPGLRQDRIVQYIRELNERLHLLESSVISKILDDPDKIDYIEEGGYQAARATKNSRISQISEMVFKGLSSEAADVVRRKRLLKIFGELDEDEVSLLIAYGKSYAKGMGNSDVQAAWLAVNRPNPIHLQSEKHEVENSKLFELGKERLINLGLLERKFKTLRKGEMPEFDSATGMMKSRVQISYLGRMILDEMSGQS